MQFDCVSLEMHSSLETLLSSDELIRWIMIPTSTVLLSVGCGCTSVGSWLSGRVDARRSYPDVQSPASLLCQAWVCGVSCDANHCAGSEEPSRKVLLWTETNSVTGLWCSQQTLGSAWWKWSALESKQEWVGISYAIFGTKVSILRNDTEWLGHHGPPRHSQWGCLLVLPGSLNPKKWSLWLEQTDSPGLKKKPKQTQKTPCVN